MEELRKRGAEPIVIGNGPVDFAAHFKLDIGFEAELYTDPSLKTYRAAEMKRMRGIPKVITAVKAIKAVTEGHFQSRTQGDAGQLGGVVIIDREGRVLYRHVSEEPGDHPSTEEILAAVS
jgi:hypothetical protein